MERWMGWLRAALFFLMGLGIGYVVVLTALFLAYVLPHGGMW